ncbi:MAG TPA: 16S rRNA (cytidine(1402)-2'-O)-methyltransferase [Gemmatimonadaceae bacterium]|nr:16S rRNA (cytidine(1402)-2'-O)-methyltransferase [Gemmatimonadaceae bacterium]
MSAGRLYVVSTPIGNMGDFSFRAVEVLKAVQLVLAEDTRHSRALLDRYGIETRTSSYHEHNEAKTAPGFVRRLLDGEDIALISDAGTPLLSDPGQRLVDAAIEAGVQVIPIPGASALLAALVVSGLDATRFTYHGFLPRRGRERGSLLDEVASSRVTSVLYEAPSRVSDTLLELAERAPGRAAVVARELTKQFEEVRRGTLESLGAYYKDAPPRGEVVLVVAGAPAAAMDESALGEQAAELRAKGMSVRDVAAELVKSGAPRNAAYRIAKDAVTDEGEGEDAR